MTDPVQAPLAPPMPAAITGAATSAAPSSAPAAVAAPRPPVPPAPSVAEAAVPAAPVEGADTPPASVPVDFSKLLGKNKKEIAKGHSKAKQSAIDVRKVHWPDVAEDDLWLLGDRKRGGFAQVPRTLSLVMNIINDITKRKTGKSVPAGKTYFVLWLHHFDEGLVKINNEADAAYEAGYDGQRNVSTFRTHMKILQEIGFIDYRKGPRGPTQFVLMRNPYKVLKQLHAQKLVPPEQYAPLVERLNDIGSRSELED